MSALSRRSLLAGTIALPATVGVHLPSTTSAVSRSDSAIVSKVAAWTATDAALTAMQLQWQDYESVVFDKARRMKISCERACQSSWPEAQAMRALDVQIDSAYAQLEASASAIRRMRAITIACAAAKIQLGLNVQGPYDWQEHALELIEDGLVELRGLSGLL